MTARPAILVVEDEPAIADTVQYSLRGDGFDVQVCGDGASALAHLEQHRPALIVMDVGLPDVNGFELMKRVRATHDTPVIFLTARGEEIDRVVGLELGADDYVTKPFSPRELVARVRTILRRSAKASGTGGATSATSATSVANAANAANAASDASTPVAVSSSRAAAGSSTAPSSTPSSTPSASAARDAPTALRHGPFDVDDGRRRIRYYGQALELSRYEYGVLKTLISRPGIVYTREQLLAMVWDDANDSFDRTVDAHVKTLRAKLRAVAPSLEAIVTHRGTGYALAEDLPAARPS
jgi:two-component system, OmpR family, catabolic regulation response regulator CreB